MPFLFLHKNKDRLIEYTELHTGESISGLEPLLTIEMVKEIAQEIWNEYN